MPRRTVPKGTRVSLNIPPGLARRLEQSPKVAGAMAATVREIASLADATVPVDSGALKASQVSEVRITPQGVIGLIAYTEFYAHMVHNGTTHSAPNPWLLNAALSVLVGQRRAA